MPKPPPKEKDDVIELRVTALTQARIPIVVVGTTPLIMHEYSRTDVEALTYPPQRKNSAERAASMKHNPREEYRSAMSVTWDPESPTRLMVKREMFKAAICDAALDIPGATKAQIGRLVSIRMHQIPLYGIPRIRHDAVRNSDMKRTPDIRFRPIIEEWCAKFDLYYTIPLLNAHTVASLVVAAGMIRGIGDWRVQKGSGDFGQWRVTDEDDEEYQAIVAAHNIEAQDAALENPEPYSEQTRDLLQWFDQEVKRRRDAPSSIPPSSPKPPTERKGGRRPRLKAVG